jgi:S1-C subfamily serine protease
VVKDEAEAVKWFRKSAEQGNASAQYNLGICYYNGQGVVKNEIEGYKWFLLAAAQGALNAKKNVSIAERRLSPAQRAEGQRLAQEWETRHANREADVEAERRPEAAVAGDDPKSTGTGFLITRNGYLVTNHHVVEDCGKVRVRTAVGLLDAEVVRVDAASDLALLKVTGTFDALPVVSSRSARLGATVATVGFPNIGLQGFEPKLAKGDIASLAGMQDDVRYFQISVPVQPGNSGGALVDEHGNVVGIVSAQLSQKAALESTGTLAQSVNYAVKSSYLLGFLESVPEASEGMPDAKTHEQEFEAMVDDVKKATVLIIGY